MGTSEVRFRFGPFELDVRAAELSKHGIRIRLHEQPFRILLMLLEHPGEVVLRDEIRRVLWPNNTVVEFDHSINAAIQRLRDALSDSAAEPRYVETVPRRGYRFIGKLEAGESLAPAQPAAIGLRPEPPPDPDSLAGKMFSHFRVLQKVGSGGMGVVYRAQDLKLGRHVALKFLPFPPGEAPVPVLERFEREARAASALSHPNICVVHGVEEDAGFAAIVMELVEGETLEARLAQGPMRLDRALPLAVQMAGALDAAHRKGIVHRDLKPANIMLTKQGAKVLDFGLARFVSKVPGSEETATVTAAGTILGTWPYMAPEQVAGKETDSRSDIFSFGCILLEMLTGRRAFRADSTAELISAILTRDPLADEPPLKTLPPAIEPILRRCLEKSPEDRFQTAGDLAFALQTIPVKRESVVAAAPPARKLPWFWIAAAGLAVCALLLVFVWMGHKPAVPPTVVRSRIPVAEDPNQGNCCRMEFSPDGKRLAYIAKGRLWVHTLATGESRDLAAVGAVLMWSPDSRFLAYSNGGALLKTDLSGGPVQTIATAPETDGASAVAASGSWGRRDEIVVAQGGSLYRLPANGGTLEPLMSAKGTNADYFGPWFLPDGKHFLYTNFVTKEQSGVYVGSIDSKPEQQSKKLLVTTFSQARYTPAVDGHGGYLLFVRNSVLMAQPFDADKLEMRGEPAALGEHLKDTRFGTGGWAAFAATGEAVAYQTTEGPMRQPTWYDRGGNALGTVGEPGDYFTPQISPDGKRLAASLRTGNGYNLWLLDLTRAGAPTQFTFGASEDVDPIWSPDGSRIVFGSGPEGGASDLYEKPADGSKEATLLFKGELDKHLSSWSPEGRYVLFNWFNAEKRLWKPWGLPMRGGAKPFPLPYDGGNICCMRFSPDGRWVAYAANESGKGQVYLQPFAVNESGTAVEPAPKYQVSVEQGTQPRWRNDGRELYFRFNGVWAVDITTSPAFHAGVPHKVGPEPDAQRPFRPDWDVAPDGKFLLMPAVKGPTQHYDVILNWQTLLKN
jgi:serine/threonine protein kinase